MVALVVVAARSASAAIGLIEWALKRTIWIAVKQRSLLLVVAVVVGRLVVGLLRSVSGMFLLTCLKTVLVYARKLRKHTQAASVPVTYIAGRHVAVASSSLVGHDVVVCS